MANVAVPEAAELLLESELEQLAGGRSKAHRVVLAAIVGTAAILAGVALLSGVDSKRQATATATQHFLTEHEQKHAGEASKCTFGRANCNISHCCATPGDQCYEQDKEYAQCRASCTQGPDPSHWDGKAWSCKELGERTSGTWSCGQVGENCSTSSCCADTGLQCFQKNTTWATCKVDCMAGAPDLYSDDGSPWSCKKLGEVTPGVSDWVYEVCAQDGEECSSKQCCATPGQQCYKQNDYWSQCMPSGSCADEGWSCDAIGPATPAGAAAPSAQGGVLPQWALDTCSLVNEGCTKSRCCLGMEVQCYEKNKDWAQCLNSCIPGRHADDGNTSWSCKESGPRSMGVAVRGSPSLYCFAVLRPDGYEPDLMAEQLDNWAGIFSCDDYSLLTADATTHVGWQLTTQFPGAPIVLSIDNTAGNTELFVNAWTVVIDLNKWRNHSFTIKADPDAVFIPQRARWHLASHLGEKMFVVNCRVGDMMFGALEVFSYSAIEDWAVRGKTQCGAPPDYGEDKYMTTCMDSLGVARVRDEPIMGDKLCGTFTDCSNSWNAAFHPFKDPGEWMQCYNDAMQALENSR